jgi:hypothetical protein
MRMLVACAVNHNHAIYDVFFVSVENKGTLGPLRQKCSFAVRLARNVGRFTDSLLFAGEMKPRRYLARFRPIVVIPRSALV